ncbi:MAG TPA: hypothetical protein VHT01_05505 [Candidatus Udaeobacter sp.]|nr:hypothetical protein [Candidatus Udaeobacter sp.]
MQASHVIVALIGALVGSGFSSLAALLYLAAVRRVARKVFQSWLIFLWFPVQILFAFTLPAPMLFPFFALRVADASFPPSNTLYAVTFRFGILGLIVPVVYFFSQWHRLKISGILPRLTGLTNR